MVSYRRFRSVGNPPEKFEMDVIIQLGFPGYFLVVADFIMWAMWAGISNVPFSLTMALVRLKGQREETNSRLIVHSS